MRPVREHATSNGQRYMITTSTWGRRSVFSREVWAKLLIDTLYRYRGSAYLLHEFVVMPDHIHVILTAKTSLEKAVQFIKGGFSYRAKKELDSNMEVWQRGFSDHRIRDASDYRLHQIYVRQNAVRKNLCERAGEYPYSSTHGGCDLDTVPQGLKPATLREADAARPFKARTHLQSSLEDSYRPTVRTPYLKPDVLRERRRAARLRPRSRKAKERPHRKCQNALTSPKF